MAIRDNLRRKIVVSGGGGSSGGGSGSGTGGITEITDGFTARFFDENNDILQVTKVRNGLWLDKPQYECGSWQNIETGFPNTFPLLLECDVDFYARSTATYADRLYAFYGVDKIEYPYISIFAREDGFGHLAFMSDYVVSGNDYRATKILWVRPEPHEIPYTTDVLVLTEGIMKLAAPDDLKLYNNDICTASPYAYNEFSAYTAINFDDGVWYGTERTADLLTVITNE